MDGLLPMRAQRSALTSSLAAAALGAVSMACSAPVGAAAGEGVTESPSSTAVVLIERTVASGESTRAEAVARFLRMRSGPVDDEALRMVGATVDFPAVGACSVLSKAKDPAIAAARAVELVDVGSVAIEANGVSISLPARRLPDIVDLVSGVVYSTRASDPDTLPSDATYILRASGPATVAGDPDFQPLVASAVAPVALGESDALVVAGQDARNPNGVTLSLDGPVDLAWGAGNPSDLVYVDITASPAFASTGNPTVASTALSSAQAVRCVFSDAGHASLAASAFVDDGSLLGAQQGLALATQGILSVHRLHREPFQARGIDSGEIRFDFARVVPWSLVSQPGALGSLRR
jgi:hypothetical protein